MHKQPYHCICALGLLRPGDIINELNGVVIKGCSLEDVCYMLVSYVADIMYKC